MGDPNQAVQCGVRFLAGTDLIGRKVISSAFRCIHDIKGHREDWAKTVGILKTGLQSGVAK